MLANDEANAAYSVDYASYYDILTGHKNYVAEVTKLTEYIAGSVGSSNPRILDVGCGTGNHAILLSDKYNIVAIDRSVGMIRMAQQKKSKVKFSLCDINEFQEDNFDFCYCLFNVINCLNSLSQLQEFFNAISRRLKRNGHFLVEAWNAIACFSKAPEIVERTYEDKDKIVIRKVVPETEFLHQRLSLHYSVNVRDKHGRGEAKSFVADHNLVLFTPLEIEHCLQQARFNNVRALTALPELAIPATESRMLAFTCQK